MIKKEHACSQHDQNLPHPCCPHDKFNTVFIQNALLLQLCKAGSLYQAYILIQYLAELPCEGWLKYFWSNIEMLPLKRAKWMMVFKSVSQVMHSQCRCTAQLTVSRWSSFSLGEAGGRPTPLSSMPLSAICVPWDSTSACLQTHTHTPYAHTHTHHTHTHTVWLEELRLLQD